MSTERELLLGVVGNTLGIIPSQALQESAFAETLVGETPAPTDAPVELASTLVATGALTPERRAFLEHMVDETLVFCEGDVGKAVEMFGGSHALEEAFGEEVSERISASGEATVGKRIELAERAGLHHITTEHPGRYSPEGELGRGGIGRVVLARDHHLGRAVAMKELLSTSSRSRIDTPEVSTHVVRFLREARVTGQLEHPNIVPVYELGKRPDGSLYYTMKIVRGRTLSEVLEGSRAEERLALLPHFTQACHGLAYAHDRGVIHRDVKPDNIMIGEFGETMILDWGLAKTSGEEDLREQDLAADAERLRGMKSSQTVDGQLLGTPLYMSPEQASGDISSIGPASDVWALGAILYEILTGRKAFAAESLGQVVERVTTGDFVPVLEAAPNASPELAAICEKALKRKHLKRFASAEELAEEIEAYLTGSRVQSYTYTFADIVKRWARRHRAAFVVSLVAFVLLSAFGVRSAMRIRDERDRALAAQAEATEAQARASHERDRAEFLVQYMLTSLKDELAPTGKLELLDSVVQAILAYYQELGIERETARHQMARALDIAAEVQMSRGEAEQATQSLSAAAKLLGGLLEGNPANRSMRLEQARNHLFMGRLRLGRGEPAEDSLVAAHALLSQLNTQHPHDGALQLALAESHMLLGQLAQSSGTFGDAHRHFESAIVLREAVAASAPETRDIEHLVAHSSERLGELFFEMGRLGDAEIAFEKALTIRDRLTQREPDNAIWLEAKALLHHSLGQLHEQRGDSHEALESYSASYAVLDALVQRDPTNTSWRSAYAQRLLAGGDLYLQREQTERARKALRRASAGFASLLEVDPGNLVWLRDLAVCVTLLGELSLREEDTEGAARDFAQGVGYLERLVKAQPNNLEAQHDLAVALSLLSRAQLLSGKLDAAEASHRQGFDRLMELTEKAPEQVEWRRDLAIAYDARLHLAAKRGDWKGAQAALDQALAVMDSLLERDPENPLWLEDRETLESRRSMVRPPSKSREKEPKPEYVQAPSLDPRLKRSDSNVRWRVLEQKHPERLMGSTRRTFFKLLENLDQSPKME